jgi:cytochrome P450
MINNATVEYDPFLYYEDPYPLFKLLRDNAPNYYNEERSLWVFSRFNDVQAAARDWSTYSSAEGVDIDESKLGPGSFLDADPPTHDQLRKILHADFTPRRMRALEPVILARATELVESLVEQGGGDFVGAFARRLPFSITCDLFGVPVDDHALLERWYVEMLERMPGQAEATQASVRAAEEMRDYIIDAVTERERSPREDLLSTVAAAHSAGRLSMDEVDGMCRLLLLAGVHTTSSLLANSLIELESDQEGRRLLAEETDRVPGAVEELLRYLSPVQAGARVTTRDVALPDGAIPRGGRVLLLVASANRDERAFPDPDVLDLRRTVERNLAFGEGIHFCLGAPLARIEAKIALPVLFSRVAEYRVSGQVEPHFTFLERGIAKLPVEVRR